MILKSNSVIVTFWAHDWALSLANLLTSFVPTK